MTPEDVEIVVQVTRATKGFFVQELMKHGPEGMLLALAGFAVALGTASAGVCTDQQQLEKYLDIIREEWEGINSRPKNKPSGIRFSDN